MMELDQDKIVEMLKDDQTIKRIKAFYQPDGCPELCIERFEDCSPVAKLGAVAEALKGCSNMADFDAENQIRRSLGEIAALLANKL
jgi:hypothetical protein